MAFEADEDILQDFLVEEGEILEQLGEQLVELEHRPGDKELLNAEADMGLEVALETEATAQATCMQRGDFREGYRAFVEKRAPQFNRS